VDTGQLPRWLGFRDEDLAANRDGRLSSRLFRRLLWSGIWRLVIGPPMAVISVVLALQTDLAVVIVIALLFTVYGLYLTWRGFAFLVDAVEGSVAFVTGVMDRREVHNKNSVTYYATIPPVSKRVSAAVYRSLPVGVRFHLYYSPGCRSLLSVEPASETEPKPAHPFGPDSAHAWDRLRGSWVGVTVGIVALLIGVHAVLMAHPARPIAVEGTVSNYYEHHGKSTTRTIYLADGSTYTPDSEDTYSPPAPLFSSLIGRQVVLYINAGTTTVIGINDGEQTYASDWYSHPEHQTTFELVNGAAVIAVGALVVAISAAIIAGHRRRMVEAGVVGMTSRRAYSPPSIRPVYQLWPAAALLLAVVLTVFLAFGIAAHH
jgi:hypothetical protein